MRTGARAQANLLAQASTLDMSRPPWRHDRLPGGRRGTSTVKYCGSRPPLTGKRNCWKELRVPILISDTNMSLYTGSYAVVSLRNIATFKLKGFTTYNRPGTPGRNPNEDDDVNTAVVEMMKSNAELITT